MAASEISATWRWSIRTALNAGAARKWRDWLLTSTRSWRENHPYLLIGVGRWGSHEPWLGIPVEWDEISGARVIVEAGFRDFRVSPSQGRHLFQNLTAFQVGYFTVNPDPGEGSVDWKWLSAQSCVGERGCVRHLRFSDPLLVLMNGRSSRGMIFKTNSTPDGTPGG